MHLRPGLSPGPRTVGTLLEELTMLPRPPSWIWGWEGKRRGGREKGGEEERKGRGGAGWGKGGEGVRVAPPPRNGRPGLQATFGTDSMASGVPLFSTGRQNLVLSVFQSKITSV